MPGFASPSSPPIAATPSRSGPSSSGSGWAGFGQALRTSARPGHSEHQLGTTIDFKSAGGPAPWGASDWARTTARSMAQSKRMEVRLGDLSTRRARAVEDLLLLRALALPVRSDAPSPGQIHDSGLSPREWLYQHGAASGSWNGGGPSATPTPSPTPTPTPSPTPTPTPSPTPTPTPSPTPTPTPSPTPTPTPSPTPTAQPTATPTQPDTHRPTDGDANTQPDTHTDRHAGANTLPRVGTTRSGVRPPLLCSEAPPGIER